MTTKTEINEILKSNGFNTKRKGLTCKGLVKRTGTTNEYTVTSAAYDSTVTQFMQMINILKADLSILNVDGFKQSIEDKFFILSETKTKYIVLHLCRRKAYNVREKSKFDNVYYTNDVYYLGANYYEVSKETNSIIYK